MFVDNFPGTFCLKTFIFSYIPVDENEFKTEWQNEDEHPEKHGINGNNKITPVDDDGFYENGIENKSVTKL